LLGTLHTRNKNKNVRKNPIFTKLKKRFEHLGIPPKLLDYFLRSNKGNINQLPLETSYSNCVWNSLVMNE